MADHQELAVGEIDDVHDAPDEAEPGGNQGVNHTGEHAVDQNLRNVSMGIR